VRGPTDAELSELPLKLEGRVTRWLGKKGLLLSERQMKQAEPGALEQATQTALRLGQLAHLDERGLVGESAGQAARAAHGHRGPRGVQPANQYGVGGGDRGGWAAGWSVCCGTTRGPR